MDEIEQTKYDSAQESGDEQKNMLDLIKNQEINTKDLIKMYKSGELGVDDITERELRELTLDSYIDIKTYNKIQKINQRSDLKTNMTGSAQTLLGYLSNGFESAKEKAEKISDSVVETAKKVAKPAAYVGLGALAMWAGINLGFHKRAIDTQVNETVNELIPDNVKDNPRYKT